MSDPAAEGLGFAFAADAARDAERNSERERTRRMAEAPPLTFTYTNHRGETAMRRVRPIRVGYGPEPKTPCGECGGKGTVAPQDGIYRPPCVGCLGTGQRLAWLLVAWDLDRGAERSFALDKIGGTR